LKHFSISLLAALGIGSAHAVTTGDAMPHTVLPDAGGKLQDLGALHAKAIYVDFWASWCTPCRKSFPFMSDLQRRYADRGLVVLAVNVDAERRDADDFLAHYPAGFTVLFDGKGDAATQFGVKGMPSSYLVGADGVIRNVHMGFREETPAAVEAELETLLK